MVSEKANSYLVVFGIIVFLLSGLAFFFPTFYCEFTEKSFLNLDCWTVGVFNWVVFEIFALCAGTVMLIKKQWLETFIFYALFLFLVWAAFLGKPGEAGFLGFIIFALASFFGFPACGIALFEISKD